MATTEASIPSETSLPTRTADRTTIHPLAPINADEIQRAATLIKAQWPAETDIHFKALTLEEPPKAETVPYLEAAFHGHDLPHIQRKVFAAYYIRNTVCIDERSERSGPGLIEGSTNCMKLLSTSILRLSNTTFALAPTCMRQSMVARS